MRALLCLYDTNTQLSQIVSSFYYLSVFFPKFEPNCSHLSESLLGRDTYISKF